LKNFKAVRDSGAIRFTPLTVFIGNNGSGKSSIVEGLETFQMIVGQGLDEAMQQRRGIE
jgi:AAA15 family ATPase/GTPase